MSRIEQLKADLKKVEELLEESRDDLFTALELADKAVKKWVAAVENSDDAEVEELGALMDTLPGFVQTAWAASHNLINFVGIYRESV